MNDGWRGRLGFLTPAPGITSSDEVRAMSPAGVQPIFATTTVRRSTVDGVRESIEFLDAPIQQLAAAQVDAVVQVAAMPSIVLGPKEEHVLHDRIRTLADRPAILAMRAAVEALRALGAAKVAAVHPLAGEIAPLAAIYLAAHEIELLAAPVLGLTSSSAVHELDAGAAYRLARAAMSSAPEAEALLLLGGGWRTLEIIAYLEADTGVPVVSTNTAMMWSALRTIGVSARQSGRGRLLEDA